jgi:hypothetical protein
MRRIASKLRKRYYGYRSAHITAMTLGFLNFHKSAQTTAAFYLDLENLDLIDKIFALPDV